MKKLFITLLAVFAVSAAASAMNYTIDDAAIDAAIESAVEVVPTAALNALASSEAAPVAALSSGNRDDMVAFLLTFFLGGFGIHRHYLGTSKWMWAAYTFTFAGIFGIVPLVDLIVEIVSLVDGSGFGLFYDNPKFLAWL